MCQKNNAVFVLLCSYVLKKYTCLKKLHNAPPQQSPKIISILKTKSFILKNN